MKRLFLVASLALAAGLASAQSAERISEILEADHVTFGQVAYLAGTCGQGLDDGEDYADALAAMQGKGLIPQGISAGDEVTAAQAAGVFMRSAGIKGGLLYRLTKSDRYAFKELKAQGIIPPTADPSMKLKGRDVMAILNGILE